MNQELIGHARCSNCRGSGKIDSESACPVCDGTGFVKPVILGTPPRSSKRRFSRYRTNLPIRIYDHREQVTVGRCLIIAEGGLAAILPAPIPIGSVVMLQLVIPTDPAALQVWAVVRDELRFATVSSSYR